MCNLSEIFCMILLIYACKMKYQSPNNGFNKKLRYFKDQSKWDNHVTYS